MRMQRLAMLIMMAAVVTPIFWEAQYCAGA